MLDVPSFEAERAAHFCELMNQSFSRFWNIMISCSIGISFFENGESFDVLYKKADLALYEAKRIGRNCFICYESQIKQNGWIPYSSTEINSNE